MMEDSSYNWQNGQNHATQNGQPQSRNMRHSRDGLRAEEGSHSRPGRSEDYLPTATQSSYLSSFCRSCCTFQHFCYLVQLVNCCLLCGLIYLIVREYPKLQALDRLDELQQQLTEDQAEIAALKEEVQTKQEGQLNDIEESLKQEQRNNFLTLAGIFTLLTCLISMFHMTTHVHKLNQPMIQRKIIAILWMSPIYSVTSFLTLIFPPIEGWMAIVKDFYESYCIYVFLSFLIAVLGEGSRDKAVEVLAKHADHLDKPTRCLGCFYEPPPDTSDHAKANAVMTQCQIYCLQFTLIRPITTIVRVFGINRNKDKAENDEQNSSSNNFYENTADENGDFDTNTNNENNSQTDNSEAEAGDESSTTDVGEDAPTESPYPQSDGATDEAGAANSVGDGDNDDNGGTRMLRDSQTRRRRLDQLLNDRWLQIEDELGGEATMLPSGVTNDDDFDAGVPFPSFAPVGGDVPFPTFSGDGGVSSQNEEMPMGNNDVPPTFSPAGTDAFVFSPIASGAAQNNSAPTFDFNNNNNTGFGGMYASNTTNGFSSTLPPTLSPTVAVGMSTDELVDQTKAYFKSPGFAIAMVVNVSIFFAFSGLLKLYHAVRDDLLWCRPFPKFLTIKAVVFLTFWQGLAITIYLILTEDQKADATLQAHRYQNLLICVEMLLVAISQWCVFPAIEWEPNYEPRQTETPGLGIKDFVSDVGQIVKRSTRKKTGRRRKKRGGANGSKSGLYHMPGFASMVSSQFDGFGGPGGRTRADSSFDDEEFENSSLDQSFESSFESSATDDRGNGSIDDNNGTADERSPYGLPPPIPAPPSTRDRILSDDTGGYSIENEGSDNDMELL